LKNFLTSGREYVNKYFISWKKGLDFRTVHCGCTRIRMA